MDQCILEILKMGSSMEQELRSMTMVRNILANLSITKSQEKAQESGLMVQSIMVNLLKIQ